MSSSDRLNQISPGQFEEHVGTFLETAVEEGFDTPEGAFSRCGDASEAFQRLVSPETIATQSFVGGTPEMVGRADEWMAQQSGRGQQQLTTKAPPLWDHSINVSNVTGSGLTVVDWTSRQFGPALDPDSSWEPEQQQAQAQHMGVDDREGWLDEDAYPLVLPHNEFVQNWQQRGVLNDKNFANKVMGL
jgi:hypothetical protein